MISMINLSIDVIISIIDCVGPLAQWLELPAHNRLVAGSSPARSTIYAI